MKMLLLSLVFVTLAKGACADIIVTDFPNGGKPVGASQDGFITGSVVGKIVNVAVNHDPKDFVSSEIYSVNDRKSYYVTFTESERHIGEALSGAIGKDVRVVTNSGGNFQVIIGDANSARTPSSTTRRK
jgi:hypothetical protein